MLFPPPLLLAPSQTREVALLRLLARLEFATGAQLRRVVLPDLHISTADRFLAALHRRRLIWRKQVPSAKVPPAVSPRSRRPITDPYLYGLTPEGREYLLALDREPEARAQAAIRTREWRRPDVRLGQLAHDTLVVAWVVSLLAEVCRSPRLRSARVELEYISAVTEAGQPLQRFDALVALTFTPEPLPARPRWDVPWWDGSAPVAGDTHLVLAGEIDRGTEKLVILLEKAVMYRDLTLKGHYRRWLPAEPVPVVLAPTFRRGKQIAREWVDGWPRGRGVVATFAESQAGSFGAWGGQYRPLADVKADPSPLHALLGWDAAAWEAQRQGAGA